MNCGALLTAFGLVFVAELGDKTQLAVVTQTCKYRQPWAVFLGASLGLAAVTGLGAVGGQLLGQIIPAPVLQGIAALAFVVMGALVAREAAQKTDESSLPARAPTGSDTEPLSTCRPKWDWKAFGATFGLLFVAELGDKTQLAVLGLAGKTATPWAVFLGGTAALASATALGVIGGEGLCRLIPKRALLWISAVMFVVMGLLMGLGAL